jgi:drug/metabolite transporter (DMT)-like permease
MRWREIGMLITLGGLWGGSYLFIRVAVPALGPLALVALRTTLAGLLLLLYALATRRRPDLRGRWGAFLVLGAINVALPFALIAAAGLRLTASLGAILNATVPIFTALLVARRSGERLTRRALAGMALGLLGVAALVGWSPLPRDGWTLLAIAASLLAALCYSLGGIYTKERLRGVPPLTLAAGQLLAAGLLVVPPATLALPSAPPPPAVILALAGLIILSTALAYILFFALLERVGPVRTHTVTYLVPFFGVLWGALFLREPLGAGAALGLAGVLAGVLLISGVQLPAPLLKGFAKPARESA